MGRSVTLRITTVVLVAILLFGYIGFTEVRIYTLFNFNWQAIQRIDEAEKRILEYEDEIAQFRGRTR